MPQSQPCVSETLISLNIWRKTETNTNLHFPTGLGNELEALSSKAGLYLFDGIKQ